MIAGSRAIGGDEGEGRRFPRVLVAVRPVGGSSGGEISGRRVSHLLVGLDHHTLACLGGGLASSRAEITSVLPFVSLFPNGISKTEYHDHFGFNH